MTNINRLYVIIILNNQKTVNYSYGDKFDLHIDN